jgi:hypothetical protein
LLEALRELRLVESERLLLHEARDPARLRRLREAIEEEGVQSHPVIVTPHGDRYLVLDGAHRVGALHQLGCRLVMTQVVEPPEVVESWNHLLRGGGVLPALRSLESVEVSGDGEAPYLARVAAAGDEAFVRAWEPGLLPEVRALWEVQGVFPEEVRRVAPGEPVKLSPGEEELVSYRDFTVGELVEVVNRGGELPAGVTRFRVQSRVLGVRFPLEKMLDAEVAARNRELEKHVRSHWERSRVRYYEEPVVMFE